MKWEDNKLKEELTQYLLKKKSVLCAMPTQFRIIYCLTYKHINGIREIKVSDEYYEEAIEFIKTKNYPKFVNREEGKKAIETEMEY